MLFSKQSRTLLVMHERSSRFTVLSRQPDKSAEPVADSLLRHFRGLPDRLRRSVSFDNGTEFAAHYRLNDELALPTFFCNAYAPWQKGGVENAIGRLRRSLPRRSDLAAMTPAELAKLADRYNRTPRQCLGFRTPQEVFTDLINRVALET